MVYKEDGSLLTNSKDAVKDEVLNIKLSDGEIKARVED